MGLHSVDRSHPLQPLLLLLVPIWLVAACADETTGDDDTVADDDVTDDDDMWADDDVADDDVADDDDASSGDACSVTFGPPEMPMDLSGTCAEDEGACEGGFDPMNSAGSCASGLTCCVHTDQCETVLMGNCAGSDDECVGEPPEGAPGFPMVGCPQDTPVCCLPEPPR